MSFPMLHQHYSQSIKASKTFQNIIILQVTQSDRISAVTHVWYLGSTAVTLEDIEE